MTEQNGLRRVIQESVPGKQITLAHVIAMPNTKILRSIGIDETNISIGIITITPPEAAAIISDVASKSGDVKIAFIDRFSGSVVLTGDVSAVESALRKGIDALHQKLGFDIPEITKS
ncbi:BMC domain-containing protein [Companilactobacillus zhongbaensis]|uniref:BMC domain-containing protein n=1 Tax=Companilactobacillus zhongbaensis TaxID=2486009 RepID=UPI000F76C6DB|nr:BMC domain-containing protein [Companilactobacillus zhongbaensis]